MQTNDQQLMKRRQQLLHVRSASAQFLMTIQQELNAIEKQLGMPCTTALVANRHERRQESEISPK